MKTAAFLFRGDEKKMRNFQRAFFFKERDGGERVLFFYEGESAIYEKFHLKLEFVMSVI